MFGRKIAKKLTKWRKIRRRELAVTTLEAKNDPGTSAETFVMANLEANPEPEKKGGLGYEAENGAEEADDAGAVPGVKSDEKVGVYSMQFDALPHAEGKVVTGAHTEMNCRAESDLKAVSQIAAKLDVSSGRSADADADAKTDAVAGVEKVVTVDNVDRESGIATDQKPVTEFESKADALTSAKIRSGACREAGGTSEIETVEKSETGEENEIVVTGVGVDDEDETEAQAGKYFEKEGAAKYGAEAGGEEAGRMTGTNADAEEATFNKISRFRLFNKRMKSIFSRQLFRTAQKKFKKFTVPNSAPCSASEKATTSTTMENDKERKKSPVKSSTIEFGRRCSWGLVPVSRRFDLDYSTETESTHSTFLTWSVEDSKDGTGQIATLEPSYFPSPLPTPSSETSSISSLLPLSIPPTPPPLPEFDDSTVPSPMPIMASSPRVIRKDGEGDSSQLLDSQSTSENIVQEPSDEQNPLPTTKSCTEHHSLPRVVAVHPRKNPLPAAGTEPAGDCLSTAKSCPNFTYLTLEAFKAYLGLSSPQMYDIIIANISEQELRTEAEERRVAETAGSALAGGGGGAEEAGGEEAGAAGGEGGIRGAGDAVINPSPSDAREYFV